jgi:hypothetical protein
MTRSTRLAAILATAAAAVAVPASAAPQRTAVDTGVVYRVSASRSLGIGLARLDATCTFRPDRMTADYGPTYVTAVATATTPAVSTDIRCSVHTASADWIDTYAKANGNAVTITNERQGTIPTWGLVFCVDATTQYLTDGGLDAHNCVPQ